MNKTPETKYWIVPIWASVSPERLIGPYKVYKNMVRRARKIHEAKRMEDSIFYLKTCEGHDPVMDSFTNDEMGG